MTSNGGKPDDIPQDVWDASEDHLRTYSYLLSSTEIVARAVVAERKRLEGALAALKARNDALRKQHGAVAQSRMDTERRERGLALDRDRWRDRAQHAEAVIRAHGINAGVA